MKQKSNIKQIIPLRRSLSENIEILLDFVERWNKQDEEKEVAEAAEKLKEFLDYWNNGAKYEKHI